MSAGLKALSVEAMTGLLTEPYRRGAETLVIPLGADGPDETSVDDYDFKEYRARFGTVPIAPKYVLVLKQSTGSDSMEIEVVFSFQNSSQTVQVKIPPRSFAGTSFAIPLPSKPDATLRLKSIRQRPTPLAGSGGDNFGVLALLGNISKLAWVLGWEKDQIGQHLRDVQQQRRREKAHGFSLDKLGEDLRVPRLPPREHSFDPDTIALYHLDDAVAIDGAVLDETTRFGKPGHPGVNAGAQSLAVGKFANGFRFPGPNGSGAITIPHDAEFDLPANSSFTVEAFVNADASDALQPRVVILKGPLDDSGTLTGAGWSLSIASFRGIANNVRWSVFHGNPPPIEVFADLHIADGKFHHLAGVLDRESQRARLFVDGEERASKDITALGALTNADDVRIGSSTADVVHALSGVVDEVRFSRVSRTNFHPVLGEGDEAYRQRLGIFERWLLPTRDALLTAVNSLVQINGKAQSFILIEKDRPSAGASKLIRILPNDPIAEQVNEPSLPAGQSIDRDGNSLTKEVDVSRLPEDDVFLVTHNRPHVDYGVDPNHHRMQPGTQNALNALIDLFAKINPPIAGNLIIDRAFDETGPGLHAVGRAVLLRHETLALDDLSALAHRAGFDIVRNDGTHINASVTAGEKFNTMFLLTHNRPQVDYGVDPNHHRMQARTQSALDALIDLLAAIEPDKNLIIDRAFDETGPGLHAVGRALSLRHETLALDKLGVEVHRAGFDFVRNDGKNIYASVAPGEKLEIVIETKPPATGVDLFTLETIILHVAPEALPADGQIRWTLIECGAGRAHFEPYEKTSLSKAIDADETTILLTSFFSADLPFKIRIDDEVMEVSLMMAPTAWIVTRGVNGTAAAPHALGASVTLASPSRTPLTSRSHLRLAADAPGETTLRVEYAFQRRVVSGTRRIRIGIKDLPDQATIAANGDMRISEAAAVGSPGEAINQIYLITSNVADVNYGDDPNNKKMQVILERAFNALLKTADLAVGLEVLKAFDPENSGLHKSGRALLLTHSRLTADVLGALAHQAGFDFVRRQENQIFCAVAAGDKIEIAHAESLAPLEENLIVGKSVDLRARFDVLPDGEVEDRPSDNFKWSLSDFDGGSGSFDFVSRPRVKFTPRQSGCAALNITYLEPDQNGNVPSTFPYTFEIRLNPKLEASNVKIPKDQYDLIMNILNFFHPIGVEVVTSNIRKHVVEVEQDPLKAFPAYTFPNFRF